MGILYACRGRLPSDICHRCTMTNVIYAPCVASAACFTIFSSPFDNYYFHLSFIVIQSLKIKVTSFMISTPEGAVGLHIRRLREQQGLSLRALAERCGLSTTAISQIERGDTSPTVSSLHMLAMALDVSITDLFLSEHRAFAIHLKPAERLRNQSPGMLMESLGIGLPYQRMEPFLVTVAPHMDNTAQPISHAGEEFVYCLEGVLEYNVDGHTYRLEKGHSLLFEATRPHFFLNPAGAPAQVLLIFQTSIGASAGRLHTEPASG